MDHDQADDERSARAALLDEFSTFQREWEATILPNFVERMLSIRLTTQQLKVLALIVPEVDGLPLQQLATAMTVSLPTMSGIVDRLADHGMVTRVADPEDHRVRRAAATDQGRDVIRKLIAVQATPSQLQLDRLALPDLRALIQGLGALLAAIAEERRAASRRS